MTDRNYCLWRHSKGDVIGMGKIAISHDNSISNIYLIESLGYNLLAVSQLCVKGYNCLFTNEGMIIFRREDSCFYGSPEGQTLSC
jgi:hypothetical protein